MPEQRIDGMQRQRIHLTVGALFVVAALMFVSAAFLGIGA